MRDIAAERREIEREIEGQTMCTVFKRTVERLGDADALVIGETKLSWNAYRDRVREATLGLAGLGFAPGSFAVIMAKNRPEHLIADLGVVHARGTPVSLYNTLAPEQVSYIVNHCAATVAFVDDASFLARFRREDLPTLKHVVVLTGDAPPGTIAWADLLASGKKGTGFDELWQGVKPDDTLTLIYTSGTTGPPKGVIDTHRTTLWVLTSSRHVLATTERDRTVSYLPLAHAADRFLQHYAGIVAGHTVHFCAEITQLFATVLAVRPTVFGGVPRIWEKLHAAITAGINAEPNAQKKALVIGAIEVGRAVVAARQQGEPVPPELAAKRAAVEPVLAALRTKIGLDQTHVNVTGAAPTPRDVLEFFHAIGIEISEVWGMSELGVVATRNPQERIKIGSIGIPLPGVEARLAPDGELQVRGGMVMAGYYKDPEKTAETIDKDGWLATGDIATVDADGYYTIVDRKKELIITAGGKNLSPSNLESLLKAHPLVGQACVIGDNRAYCTALVVLDGQGAPAWAAARGIAARTIAELAADPAIHAEIAKQVAAVNERVSRVENIRKWTLLATEWTAESEELTPTLKLKRRVIVDKYAAQIAEMYTEA